MTNYAPLCKPSDCFYNANGVSKCKNVENTSDFYKELRIAENIKTDTEKNRFDKMMNHNKHVGVYGLYSVNKMNDYTGFGTNGLDSLFINGCKSEDCQ